MSRRVVVTGLGAVTPIGNNVDDFWEAVKAGKSDLTTSQNLTQQIINVTLQQSLRILIHRILWTERLQREWSHSHSTL